MLRRAWRSTIGRVARRGGAPGASAAAYGGGGAGTVASSYLECVERLRTCVQSLDRDVTAGGRASLRVARAVRGAAEDCLAGSRGGAARRGGDVQVACAVAELRKVADALVVEIERRGALGFSEEPDGEIAGAAYLKHMQRCGRALAQAEALLYASAAQWMEGLTSLPESAAAAVDALIVKNQRCAKALAHAVRVSLDDEHGENREGHDLDHTDGVGHDNEPARRPPRLLQGTRRERRERGVHALRILAAAALARPGRLRRFLQSQRLVPGSWRRSKCGRGITICGTRICGHLMSPRGVMQRGKGPQGGGGGEGSCEQQPAKRHGSDASWPLNSVSPSRSSMMQVVQGLWGGCLLQASLASSGGPLRAYLCTQQQQQQQQPQRKGGSQSDQYWEDLASVVVLPLARALAAMATRWNQGHGGVEDDIVVLTLGKGSPPVSSWAFASEGLLVCALDEQRWRRTALVHRQSRKETGLVELPSDSAGEPSRISKGTRPQPTSCWSTVVATLAPPFASDPFAPYLQWFPLLLCRLSHLYAVRATVGRIGLRHVLRAISLGCWPPPWRSAPRSSRSASVGTWRESRPRLFHVSLRMACATPAPRLSARSATHFARPSGAGRAMPVVVVVGVYWFAPGAYP